MCTRPYMKEGPIKCESKHGESANTENRMGVMAIRGGLTRRPADWDSREG